MTAKIRGEYWIVDGRVDFADGDVGDQNHEMVALNSVASEHLTAIHNCATDMGLERVPSIASMEDEPLQSAQSLLELVEEKLFSTPDPNNENLPLHRDQNAVRNVLAKKCGIDMETLALIMQDKTSVDPRLYVMKRGGWIAVRDNNAELFGYDQKKRKELADGLDEILEQEGIEEPDEEVEVSVYDHKTKRSFDLTLADLRGESPMRPQTLPNTTYNKPLFVPPEKTGAMPRSMDARTRSMLQTSESVGFREWLLENCGGFLVRRTWPFLSGGDEATPVRPASRRTRRVRRR